MRYALTLEVGDAHARPAEVTRQRRGIIVGAVILNTFLCVYCIVHQAVIPNIFHAVAIASLFFSITTCTLVLTYLASSEASRDALIYFAVVSLTLSAILLLSSFDVSRFLQRV